MGLSPITTKTQVIQLCITAGRSIQNDPSIKTKYSNLTLANLVFYRHFTRETKQEIQTRSICLGTYRFVLKLYPFHLACFSFCFLSTLLPFFLSIQFCYSFPFHCLFETLFLSVIRNESKNQAQNHERCLDHQPLINSFPLPFLNFLFLLRFSFLFASLT